MLTPRKKYCEAHRENRPQYRCQYIGDGGTHCYKRRTKETTRTNRLAHSHHVDLESNHKNALSLRAPGTGQWFLESSEFHDWLTGSNGFMWLHGIRKCRPQPECLHFRIESVDVQGSWLRKNRPLVSPSTCVAPAGPGFNLHD